MAAPRLEEFARVLHLFARTRTPMHSRTTGPGGNRARQSARDPVSEFWASPEKAGGAARRPPFGWLDGSGRVSASVGRVGIVVELAPAGKVEGSAFLPNITKPKTLVVDYARDGTRNRI